MQRPSDSEMAGSKDLQSLRLQAGSMPVELNRELIELALERSPTGGNSRPFQWFWEGQTLQIVHSEKLAKHYLNRNNNTSWIALGCMLKSLEVAANFQGFKLDYKISLQNLSMQVEFLKNLSPNCDDGDLAALTLRSTYRGPLAFSEKPVLEVAPQASQLQVRMAQSSDMSRETKKYLTEADTYLWLQTQATRDFFKEIKFSKTLQTHQDRGIRVIDLGIGKADQGLLRFFSWLPWLPSLMARIPVLNSSFHAATTRSLKNAHLIVVSATELNPLNLVKVGQEALQVWIEMEKQGYKVQPLSLASIPLLDAATGFLPDDTKPQFRNLFLKIGPEVLRKQFQLSPEDKPVWLLRVGRPKTQ